MKSHEGMQIPFAFSDASGSPRLYESEKFAWILFAISVLTVVIFFSSSWYFFHKLRITILPIGLLLLHPRLWLDAYHGDGGSTLRVGSILFFAVITIYVVSGSIVLYKQRKLS
jgi:hypothetical protein